MRKIYKSEKELIISLLEKQHPNAECELNFKTPFELLVAVILSAQCTDKRVNVATEKLFSVYNTAEAFSKLSLDELKPYIYSCGFFNNKGKNIIAMSKKLVTEFNGEVPSDMESLLMLDGVGRKTASVVQAVAFNIPAMPVDTHVFRVSRRIGFSNGKDVNEVEKDMCKCFPTTVWNKLHHLLIFHGRYVCKSQNPDCNGCGIKEYCKDYNNRSRLNG